MAENNFVFWTMTLNYFKDEIKKSEDYLVVLVHWLLLKNRFQVLGPGHEKEINDKEQPSDILPINWSHDEVFKFRYVYNNKLYLLNGVNAGSGFIFNFYNVTTEHVTSAALGNITTTVECIKDMANNKDNFLVIVDLLQKELIDPIKSDDTNKKNSSTQTHDNSTHVTNCHDHLHATASRSIGSIRQNQYPFAYGMPDLDPMYGLREPGVGMIFEPRRPDRLPGRLPMPRFDPIRPNFPFGVSRPNPDHVLPPDFDDELFM